MRRIGGVNRLEFPIGKSLGLEDVYGGRFTPDGEEFVFWKGSADGFELQVIDRQGKAGKPLTSGWAKIEGIPSWADGGREVWFTASKAGEPEALWAVRRSGEVRRLIRVPGSLELYDVSSDGRALVGHHTLVSLLQGLAPGQASEIDLSWLDSSKPSDLSADGSMVLITEDGEGSGGRPSVYLRATDGSQAVRIGEGYGLALSPDKKWVLARREENGRRTFVLMPTGPGQPRPLAFEGLDVTSGVFTPDGQRIVFDATAPGQPSRLYVADLSGGKPRAVGPPGTRLQPFTSPVSPDGRRVVAIREGKFSPAPAGRNRRASRVSRSPRGPVPLRAVELRRPLAVLRRKEPARSPGRPLRRRDGHPAALERDPGRAITDENDRPDHPGRPRLRVLRTHRILGALSRRGAALRVQRRRRLAFPSRLAASSSVDSFLAKLRRTFVFPPPRA